MGKRWKSDYDKPQTYEWEVIGAILTLCLVLEMEAENIKARAADMQASEMGKVTANDPNTRSWQIIKAISFLIKEYLKEGKSR